ncbi:MAG TPA: hypothetical protein VJ892_03175 [Candidatus Absconditabacterales bacterium]|nr:hypothetical protein [Candidatus Absconditabacterales bacterium]
MNKVKYRIDRSKKRIMRFSHYAFLKIRRTPRVIRYTLAIIFFVLGGFFLPNPLLPGRLMILIGIGIFLPGLQYKYIGRHFKSDNIKKIEESVISNIEIALNTNPRWYHKYKSKIKKIWKRFNY